MARTSKSRGKSGFKMKSGNTTSFKMMGSSPTKFTNPATGEELNPNAPDIISNMGALGVSNDILQTILDKKMGAIDLLKKQEGIKEGTIVDTDTEVKENVAEVKEIKTPTVGNKTEKLKGGSYAFGESEKDYRKNREGSESKYQYQVRKKREDKLKNKGLKDLTGTIDTDPVDLTRPQTGPRETGGGGASFTPTETSELSFGDVFAREYEKQGPGGEFEYKGKKYTTYRADDKNYGKYKHTDKIIENFKQPEVKKVEEVKTVEEELKKKGFDFSNKGGYDFSITDEFNNPISKKSPYKKYGKTAKGKRGFKMRRK